LGNQYGNRKIWIKQKITTTRDRLLSPNRAKTQVVGQGRNACARGNPTAKAKHVKSTGPAAFGKAYVADKRYTEIITKAKGAQRLSTVRLDHDGTKQEEMSTIKWHACHLQRLKIALLSSVSQVFQTTRQH
jgi:hypothetical protein